MLVANLAALFAKGCEWRGLDKAAVLAVDLDFQAPGLHFYDFAARFDEPEITVAGESVSGWKEALIAIEKRPIGVLHWLSAISEAIYQKICADFPDPASYPDTESLARIVTDFSTKILKGDVNRSEIQSAEAHIVRVSSSNASDLILLPAAHPRQDGYSDKLLDFDYLNIFEDLGGYAALDALYAYVLSKFLDGQPRKRVLLDQGGGLNIPGVINWGFSDHHVIVSGLNKQHRAGLICMLEEDSLKEKPVSVVLSQYGARRLAAGPVSDREIFLNSDEIRRKLSKKLTSNSGIPVNHIHLVDFELDAVGEEYFFPEDSDAFDELVNIAVTIERQGEPVETGKSVHIEGLSEKDYSVLRVLGEYVGTENESPSGALGGFTAWLRETLGSGCKVQGYAATHDQIRDIVSSEKSGDAACPWESLKPTGSGDIIRLDSAPNSDCVGHFSLADFDIVAMPLYLAEQAQAEAYLDALRGYDDKGGKPIEKIETADALGSIGEAYAKESIHGWENYARSMYDGQPTLLGYPLFVDHQLLVINQKNLDKHFKDDYQNSELREFRGFSDPADLIAAARVAHENARKNKDATSQQLLLTLTRDSVARWYEWKTLMALMGAASEPSSHRALQAYRKLCGDAHDKSKDADWDVAHQVFFSDEEAGMLLIWPDAIPLKARGEDKKHYQYIRPPGIARFEECWLLTIPKGRGADRPSTESVESLLRRFLTYEAQQIYLEQGGLPVHKRILRSIENWQRFAFLPPLEWRQADRGKSEATRYKNVAQREQDLEAIDEIVLASQGFRIKQDC
uniref:Uncharacterized protein n=1 Tax=Candidatus Kentrum sp. LPFa TaxID=2126335 RepID=A0A450XEV0_9GAMM|nr:MAG: hypothetical protein BECKLPF1236C_GA0070990_100538 [Candidatus Kentron sp. LPFa]